MQEKSPIKLVTVTDLHENQRIDNFLMRQIKGLPKSHLYRILRKGEVRVNKKRIKPDYRLKSGDIIRIPPLRLGVPEEPIKPSSSLEKMLANRILYEDAGLLIINKPAGMAVHGGSGISLGVIEALRAMRPKEPYLELVHRLDRETSGCLLLAKKPAILKELHELLRNGQLEKKYTALVKGYWPKHLHFVDESLKKFQLQSGERMVNVNVEGKASLTEFRVLQRFASSTLVEAKPKTGRTHQIRVHAAHVGHPVAADEKYGDKEFNKQIRELGLKRLFLHASSLNFTLPATGQHYSVSAPLDADVEQLLKQLV